MNGGGGVRRLHHTQVTSLPGSVAMGSLLGRLIAALVFIFVLAGAAPNSAADPYEDALAGFLTDSFTDTADAIEAVVASGSPKGAALLEALQDGRLLYSAEAKKVYIKDKADKLTDAATGEAVDPPPADADAVRLNNRLRGMLGGMLGGLTLMSPE